MSDAIAGMGRRDLTRSQGAYLESVGMHLAEQGLVLTTGNAQGVDQSIALGASIIDPDLVELYLPWPRYEMKKAIPGQTFWTADQALPAHVDVARRAHPAWDHLKDSVRKLMIRNAMIIMRWSEPVRAVWAFPNTEKRGWGGTGHGIRCAAVVGVPVYLLNEQRWWSPTEGTT